MTKLIFLISFSIFSLLTFAQPTSFGGITPGQTTREELKSLVRNPNKIGTDDYVMFLELTQPEGKEISVRLHNDIVYELGAILDWSPELLQALTEKYGLPSIKVGGIRTVTCRNKLGASFERLEGEEELKWRVKDGVQGAIRRSAGNCADHTLHHYLLRHVATVKKVEKAKLEQERKTAEEKRRNLGNAY